MKARLFPASLCALAWLAAPCGAARAAETAAPVMAETFPTTPQSVETGTRDAVTIRETQSAVDGAQSTTETHLSFASSISEEVRASQAAAAAAQKEANTALSKVTELQRNIADKEAAAGRAFNEMRKGADTLAKAETEESLAGMEAALEETRRELEAMKAGEEAWRVEIEKLPRKAQDSARRDRTRAEQTLERKLKKDEGNLKRDKSARANALQRIESMRGMYANHVSDIRKSTAELPAAIAGARTTQAAARAAQEEAYRVFLKKAESEMAAAGKTANADAKPPANPASTDTKPAVDTKAATDAKPPMDTQAATDTKPPMDTKAATAPTDPAASGKMATADSDTSDSSKPAATEPPPAAVDSSVKAAMAGSSGTASASTTAPTTATTTAAPGATKPSSKAGTSGGASSPGGSGSPMKMVDAARTTETEIAKTYAEIRATDLAQIRGTSLAAARANTDTPVPNREAVDAATLSGSPSSDAELAKYNEAMLDALSQMDSMIRFSGQLLDAVAPPPATAEMAATDGSSSTTASVHGSSAPGGGGGVAVSQALEKDAADAAGDNAKDLTGLMHAAYENVNPFDEAGALLARFKREKSIAPEIGGKAEMLAAKPGRRVAPGLPAHDWMYVDSWYMIGPFPNPDRRNKDRQFPPETVVDLDAVYEGDGGRQVRWDFIQTAQPVVRFLESYTIYYAYTELWFDQPHDLWIAAGADDAARLWINDLQVWNSAEILKAWSINEAYRKVSFKKGLNRVLYRVENAPSHGWFSLLLHVNPAVAPQQAAAK